MRREGGWVYSGAKMEDGELEALVAAAVGAVRAELQAELEAMVEFLP